MWVKAHDITRDQDTQRWINDDRWKAFAPKDTSQFQTSASPFPGVLCITGDNTEIELMTFSEALTAIKDDKIVTRVAWNGGVFLFLKKSEQMDHPTVADTKLPTQPAIMVKGHHGVVSSFCPTDADLLADDWTLINI